MIQTVIPQLRMTDATRSLAFYAALGFSVDWEHRFEAGMPLFAQLTRDGQTLFLTAHAGDCAIGGAVYFKVPDVDACARAFAAAVRRSCSRRSIRTGVRAKWCSSIPTTTGCGSRSMPTDRGVPGKCDE